MNGCSLNYATGYCDQCSCYSSKNTDGEWFCIAAENDRQQRQWDREDWSTPELEFDDGV